MNNFEHLLINTIVSYKNIKWWHRIIDRKGLRLNGYMNHYPDFIVMTNSGNILLIEAKGDYLNGDDSKSKLKLCSREPNYHQLLIFENEDEKNEFDNYLCEHFSDYTDDFIADKYQHQIKEDTDDNLGGLQYSAFQVAKAALLYEDWKKCQTQKM